MSYNSVQITRLLFKKMCCAAEIFRECTLHDESYGQMMCGGWRVRHGMRFCKKNRERKCEKQESNLRTPARIDLESIPVDHLGILAWNNITAG